MKRLWAYAILICLLSLSWRAAAQSRLSLEQEGDRLRVHFALGGLSLREVGDSLVMPMAEDLSSEATPPRRPLMPTATRIIFVPRECHLRLASVSTLRSSHRSLPAQCRMAALPEPFPKGDSLLAPRYREAVDFEGHPEVELQEVGLMWNRRVYRLTVRPVQYSNRHHRLHLHEEMEAEVVGMPTTKSAPVANEAEVLIVVARTEMKPTLQPFLQWKRQQGYDVREVYLDTSQTAAVKNAIRQEASRVHTSSMPYLLLVGNTMQIQPSMGKAQPKDFPYHVTDLPFADLTGDGLPDMMVGRWPVDDTLSLGMVVRKSVAYEQLRWHDSLSARRMLFVAGAEQTEPAPITTNGAVYYLAQESALHAPDADTLCFRNPASAEQLDTIVGILSQGPALAAYTAHCTAAGWSSPKLRISSFDSVNTPVPTVMINNCCSSNDFSTHCFGEQMLLRERGGVVAAIGATNNTLWNEDYYWAVGPKYPFALQPQYDSLRLGAFDCLWYSPSAPSTVGEQLVAGNMAVSAFGSPYDKFYWEIYCLLGDPTLHPQLYAPTAVQLTLVDTLRVGDVSVRMKATAGATVTVLSEGRLLGRAIASAIGEAVVPLSQSIDTLPLLCTATSPTSRPAMVEAYPATPLARVGFYSVQLSDSVVAFSVANLSKDTLRQVQLILREEQTMGVNLLADTLIIDTLLPHSRLSIELPYRLIHSVPSWTAAIVALADSQKFSLPLSYSPPYSAPLLALRIDDADGNAAKRIRLGETYSLHAEAAGDIDSIHINIYSHPTGGLLATLSSDTPSVDLSFTLMDTLTHVRVQTVVGSWIALDTTDYYLPLGNRLDDFEQALDCFPWKGGGTLPWAWDSTAAHSGQYSMRSGPIEYRQTSDLLLHVCLPSADTLRYWAKTSTELNADRLSFAVDGVARAETISGETGWREMAFRIPAGCHWLRWRYTKDETIDAGNDCVWIDDVRLPMALWPNAYGCLFDDVPDDSLSIPTASASPLHLSPNPTLGEVLIESQMPIDRLTLYDLFGRPLLQHVPSRTTSLRIDLHHLPAGMYLVAIVAGGEVSYHKLILQH